MHYTPMQIARLKLGMTQKQASERLGISYGYLSQIESYKFKAKPEVLQQMTKLYKCKMMELFPSCERMMCK